jgi:hypothetical protein
MYANGLTISTKRVIFGFAAIVTVSWFVRVFGRGYACSVEYKQEEGMVLLYDALGWRLLYCS